MAIGPVVTMGFGNGTLTGTIPLVTRMGYGSAVVVVEEPNAFATGWTAPTQLSHYTAPTSKAHWTAPQDTD